MIRAEKLLEQAEALVQDGSSLTGPSEEDLRRAISSAYYPLFHQCLAAAADTLVGEASRASDLYGLAYRSVDHRRLRDLGIEFGKPQPSKRYAEHLRAADLDPGLITYAGMVVDLYEFRASADYDPTWMLEATDAKAILEVARAAHARFEAADPEKRRRFLIPLHFPPR